MDARKRRKEQNLRILLTPIDNFKLFLLFASMNIKEILLTCDLTTINQ
jgi:hypothetical protein